MNLEELVDFISEAKTNGLVVFRMPDKNEWLEKHGDPSVQPGQWVVALNGQDHSMCAELSYIDVSFSIYGFGDTLESAIKNFLSHYEMA